MPDLLDVVIVGAGPAGLAAGIAAARSKLSYLVIEKGSLVNSIFHFPRNMVFFTTPELLEIGGFPFSSPYEKPTRAEALRYYRKVVDACDLKVALDEDVQEIMSLPAPENKGSSFQLESVRRDGLRRFHSARFVVLATGYYDHPNLLGVPGEDLPHVSHYFTEPHSFYRKSVVVVGGNNSAAETALELFRAGARVTLVHRKSRLGESVKYWVRPDIINRIKEGSIAVRFHARVVEITARSVQVEGENGKRTELPAEGVFLMTGYHPDVDLLSRAGVRLDDQTCIPEHDPDTFETNIPGLYLAGAVAAGKQTNRIFIENGRFHGQTVIKHIASQLRHEGQIRPKGTPGK